MCVAATPALACSCAPFTTAKAALKKADAVFVGKVVDISVLDIYSKIKINDSGKTKTMILNARYYKVKFAVSQSWKGAPRRTASVLTNYSGSAACGYSFAKAKTYIVYAHASLRPGSKYKDLYTSICERTANVLDAKKDLIELGKGKVPRV